jgi:branched-subunit amino acid transport protein
MDAALKLWLVVAIFARRRVPPLLVRAFRYVPAAMLTALVLPMVVGAPVAAVETTWPRACAAVLAGVVAFRTHSTLKTLAAGMLALWLLQAGMRAIG